MQTIINILKVIFAPISMIGKLYKEDNTYVLCFLSIVFWFVSAIIAWAVIATTAMPLIQIVTFVITYGLSILYYYWIDGKGKDDSIGMFFMFLFIGIIAGYATGIAGHAFFLLY